ncbi:DUF2167 domain-containing protein [Ramlibacter humi]|uniref:DUF2167 domain-containing protein n=1 Tax=Ramlibacter humi TaxID=2530451 RepID=A0A4Z0BCF0_9BURK|nr:DUF2167 domain-containing protein [Ramlibacter humi]TFY96163.1 DUF2167 domain-containing protein [Ramlibacter humi]
MNRKWMLAWVLAVAGLLGAAAAHAQNAQAEAEQKAAFEAAGKVKVAGPADVPVRDQAVLKLPDGYVFIPQAESERLLRSMGNSGGSTLVGTVFPVGKAPWFAVVRYINEGHIADSDAKDWNADDLLKSLREGTEAGNQERAKKGIPEMEIVGWAEAPAYNAGNHRLVWSASTRDKGTTGTQGLGVNYNTYALGREGYISLNLVTDLDLLPQHKPSALQLLSSLEYNGGRRYTDFNSSTDHVAAYGLAALVAGAAAKKLGLFALALAFLAKFAKVIVVAGGAALWSITKLFKRRQPAVAAAEDTVPAPMGPGGTPPKA